jgi:hypothetical protein
MLTYHRTEIVTLAIQNMRSIKTNSSCSSSFSFAVRASLQRIRALITVASQWKMESSSTTEFMFEFHPQMPVNKKISKAEALRPAELNLMRSAKYRHPSYWAPWVLVGDGS